MSWAWWCIPVISAFVSLEQEDSKLEATLGYTARLYFDRQAMKSMSASYLLTWCVGFKKTHQLKQESKRDLISGRTVHYGDPEELRSQGGCSVLGPRARSNALLLSTQHLPTADSETCDALTDVCVQVSLEKNIMTLWITERDPSLEEKWTRPPFLKYQVCSYMLHCLFSATKKHCYSWLWLI